MEISFVYEETCLVFGKWNIQSYFEGNISLIREDDKKLSDCQNWFREKSVHS